MKKRIIAVLTAVALLLGGSLALAAPASAGTCTIITSSWHLCGTVRHSGVTGCTVKIVNNWPAVYGTVRVLGKGKVSNAYFRDTDGFVVTKGFATWGGKSLKRGVWYKVNNAQYADVICRRTT